MRSTRAGGGSSETKRIASLVQINFAVDRIVRQNVQYFEAFFFAFLFDAMTEDGLVAGLVGAFFESEIRRLASVLSASIR